MQLPDLIEQIQYIEKTEQHTALLTHKFLESLGGN
jgi:hypothetical protein